VSPSDPLQLLALLEGVLSRLHIDLRREALNPDPALPSSSGGLCRIQGRSVLFVDATLPPPVASAVILEALCTLDLSAVYLPPVVREHLDACAARRAMERDRG